MHHDRIIQQDYVTFYRTFIRYVKKSPPAGLATGGLWRQSKNEEALHGVLFNHNHADLIPFGNTVSGRDVIPFIGIGKILQCSL